MIIFAQCSLTENKNFIFHVLIFWSYLTLQLHHKNVLLLLKNLSNRLTIGPLDFSYQVLLLFQNLNWCKIRVCYLYSVPKKKYETHDRIFKWVNIAVAKLNNDNWVIYISFGREYKGDSRLMMVCLSPLNILPITSAGIHFSLEL